MFKEHTIFIPPNDPDQIIWRYLDFTKFVDLLSTSSLYFNRADCFADIFEGSLPKKTVEWRDNIELERLNTIPDYIPVNWAKHFYNQKKEIAINCWHMNNFESEAMWKLYLQSNEGIAIQSTYSRLIKCFKNTQASIHIGQVYYIDYETEFIDPNNGFNPILHKRKSFEHEKELRAVLWIHEPENQNIMDMALGGTKVPVDLNSLVEKIYLSPNSPNWFSKLVQEVMQKYGHSFAVINSKLIEKPIF